MSFPSFLRAISRALLGRRRITAGNSIAGAQAPGPGGSAGGGPSPSRSIRQRLREEAACLERLDAARQRRGDARLGKSTENRVVWGELIDLELQEIDELVKRISGASSENAHASLPSPPREGGPWERNHP